MVEKGSVFGSWFEKISQPYTNLLRDIILRLRSVPRFSSVILERDMALMKGFCELFNIQYDEELLYNYDYFTMIKYKVIKEVKKVAEEKLKPEDPYLKLLEKLNVEDIKSISHENEISV